MAANDTKKEQLGLDPSTAQHILRKSLLFDMAKRLDLCTCYRCHEPIISVNDFSIDHKVPWLYSPKPIELFFSLDNIAFSHLKCNCADARRVTVRGPRDTTQMQEGNRLKWKKHFDSIPEGYSKCSMCKQMLPVSMFGSRKSAKRGVSSECKACRKATRTS